MQWADARKLQSDARCSKLSFSEKLRENTVYYGINTEERVLHRRRTAEVLRKKIGICSEQDRMSVSTANKSSVFITWK